MYFTPKCHSGLPYTCTLKPAANIKNHCKLLLFLFWVPIVVLPSVIWDGWVYWSIILLHISVGGGGVSETFPKNDSGWGKRVGGGSTTRWGGVTNITYPNPWIWSNFRFGVLECVTGTRSGSLGGVFCTGGILIKGVWEIWYFSYTFCTYVLFLCMVTWTDTPVTFPFLLEHEWSATWKPAL